MTSAGDSEPLDVSASVLLSNRLNLEGIIRNGEDEKDGSRWWAIPPRGLNRWCANRHGTVHGGLSLAVLFALCKAHVAARDGKNHRVSAAHVLYMAPVPISSPLWVRTFLEEGKSGEWHATAEVTSKRGDLSNIMCRALVHIDSSSSPHL